MRFGWELCDFWHMPNISSMTHAFYPLDLANVQPPSHLLFSGHLLETGNVGLGTTRVCLRPSYTWKFYHLSPELPFLSFQQYIGREQVSVPAKQMSSWETKHKQGTANFRDTEFC